MDWEGKNPGVINSRVHIFCIQKNCVEEVCFKYMRVIFWRCPELINAPAIRKRKLYFLAAGGIMEKCVYSPEVS